MVKHRAMKSYPIFCKNALYLMRLGKKSRESKSQDVVHVVTACSGAIGRWLDRTRVKEDRQAQRVVNHLFKAISRVADFSVLSYSHPLKNVYIRLKGLAE